MAPLGPLIHPDIDMAVPPVDPGGSGTTSATATGPRMNALRASAWAGSGRATRGFFSSRDDRPATRFLGGGGSGRVPVVPSHPLAEYFRRESALRARSSGGQSPKVARGFVRPRYPRAYG